MRIESVASAAALLAATALPAQYGTDSQASDKARPFELMVGDPAPSLAIGEWVKGDPITGFEQGSVYVVEFWATWCGPCIAGMPHISELQEKFADKGVKIVGVNIRDEPKNVAPFMEKDAPIHNVPGDEIMRYTVAIEEKDDDSDIRNGVMEKTWMRPAGRRGIPSAFIVDQNQRIAWIGHPMSMDKPLEKVVEGKWNLEEEAANYAMAIAAEAKVQKYQKLFAKQEYEKAYALGNELVDGPLAKNPSGLNSMAWGIVDPDRSPKVKDLDLALKAAVRANELTESEDGNILDTLALVYYERGDLTEAVKFQRLAVKHSGEGADPGIAKRLKKFEKELGAADASAKK